ncbi:hypothetical protein SLEP1_g2158 [Rubroshorea leprosula]|uniref:Uncharacterized protein n=1 Tax=Rubroshorea leprosula TaxID=152421 RepID=A0AAV5HKN6_9ROSI|nr:hypothetical protein SLEP1_g2158 [Rubroshorea leprosula]
MLVGKTTLVMKDVITMLLENDKFLREDDGANQNNALVMEQSQGRYNGCGGGGNEERSKSRPKKDYGEVQCFYCMLACEECDPEVEQNNQRWILDSTATVHLCNNPSRILSLVWRKLGKIKYVGKQEWHKVYKGGRLVLHGRKNKHDNYVLEQDPKKGLNKTMRKMVWKPKGILVDGKEINKTKKKASLNNEVVFDDGSRRRKLSKKQDAMMKCSRARGAELW